MASNGAGIWLGTKDRLGMVDRRSPAAAHHLRVQRRVGETREGVDLEADDDGEAVDEPIMHGCGTSRMNSPRRAPDGLDGASGATAAKRYSGPCDATSGANHGGGSRGAGMTPGCGRTRCQPMSAAAWADGGLGDERAPTIWHMA